MKNQEHETGSLTAVIRPWRLRLALKGALRWAILGSGVGLGLAVVLLAAARLVPWPDVFLWGVVATVAGTTAGVVYGVLGRPSREATARQADHLLGLSDRLGTAWELRNSGSPFATLQRQDALASAGALDPGEVINMWPVRSHFLPLLIGLVLIGLLVVLPNPMDGIIRQQEHFQEQLAQVEEELLKTKEHVVGPDTSLSAEERAAAEEALEKLQEALTEAKGIPSVLTALSDAEQEIGSLQEPKIGHSRGLRDVGAILAESPTTQALGQALHSMDGAALLDAMDALAARLSSMSEEELQELAASLQRTANAATGNEALSGSLRQASRAIASGDPSTAGGDLGDLADRLASLQEAVEASEALEGALADLRGARSFISGVALVQAGGGIGAEGGSRDGGGSVSGPGQGGEGGNGAGGGRGTGGATGIGSGGGTGGSGAGDQPGARRGEDAGRLLTDGETVFVPGQGPGIPTEVRARPGTGIAPGRLLPFGEVLGEYAQQAREHMERSPVPQGYKDLVRRYFTELEP